MKPKYIFFAVAAICIMMLAVLPQLGAPHSAQAASASAPPAAAAPAAVAAAEPLPVTATLAPEPTLAPIAEQQGADAEAAGADTAGAASASAASAGSVVVEAAPEAAAVEAPAVEAPSAPPAEVSGGDLPVFNPPTAVPGAPAFDPSALPDLQSFAGSVLNGQADTIVGFYSPGHLALAVLQQPNGDDNFIAEQDGTVTQFARPGEYQSIGMLAHNTLSGRLFFKIGMDDELDLVFGDGRVAKYRVSAIQSYQALSPYDTRSDFVDLNTPDAPLLSHRDLFERVYTTPGRLVLQTCIDANGVPTWGRLFIIADPV